MFMIYLLTFFVAIAASLGLGTYDKSGPHDLVVGHASAVAASLAHQHAAAIRACDNAEPVCQVGTLPIRASLPGAPGHFISKRDGSSVLTTWDPAPGDGTLPGNVVAALQTETSSSIFAGAYDMPTDSVGGRRPAVPGGPPLIVRVPVDLQNGLVDTYPIMLSCLHTECIEH